MRQDKKRMAIKLNMPPPGRLFGYMIITYDILCLKAK